MMDFFRDRDVDEFELVGLFVTPCLMANAVMLKGCFPEARIAVDSALTMAIDSDIGEKAFDVMENMQIDVINRKKESKDQISFYRS